MGDRFEAEHMAEEVEVLHRDKRVSRGMAVVLGAPAFFCWALAVFIALANATSDKPLPAVALPFVVAAIAGLGVLFAGLSLTMAVLRTVVTERAVVVKYGLWGPEIELSSITECEVVRYDMIQFGGWGIKRGLGGVWAYVPGPGDVVALTYQAGDEIRRVQIGARDAHALANAIQRGRGALAQGRIVSAPDNVGARDVDAEAELEAAAIAEAAPRALPSREARTIRAVKRTTPD